MKNKTIGQRLGLLWKEYPELKTLERLANALGCTRGTVENILNDKTNPSSKITQAIVDVLGTTHAWIIDGKGEMLPNGKKELTRPSKTIDPWRDALVAELRAEAKKWYDEYQEQKAMLKMALQSLGKLDPVNRTTLRVVKTANSKG